MVMTKVAIELPERDSYGELMKGFLTLMRAFGLELAAVCNSALSPQLGNWWFQKLVQERLDQKKLVGQQQDLEDPTIVLKEICWEHNSPIHGALAPDAVSIKSAKKIMAKRNELLHFGKDPALDDIGEVAQLVQMFARHYNLSIDGAIVPLLNRLHRIKRGQYPVVVAPIATSPQGAAPAHEAPPTPPAELPAEVEITKDLPRPKIGGVWLGPVPPAEFKPTKAGDLVSIASGDSVKDRISGDASARLRTWLAPVPKGNLWIAGDGAVGGFVAAIPRLLGYTGEEPPGEIARGFLYRRYFEVVGSRVRDLESGREFDLPDSAPAVEGEVLRLTTYGDVIRIDDDGVTRLAIIDPKEWTR